MGQPIAEFQHAGIHLLGFSLAGEETYIVAPEMNLGFDVGRAPRDIVNIDHIFLSHGHMDHAAGIAYYFSQRMFIGNQPGQLYAPQPLVAPIQRLLRAWKEIDGHEPPAKIHPAVPGVDISLRRDLIVRPFPVNHPCKRHDHSRVPSLGYAAIEVRQKLKPQYEGLPGPQLVELKSKGVQITRRLEIPLLTYCGDTAPGDFFELDYVRNSKILLLECTFVEKDHRDRAQAGHHMHISDLRDVFPHLNNERILLTHLSRRTLLAEARRRLQQELGQACNERVIFLMDHRLRRRRRSAHPQRTPPTP